MQLDLRLVELAICNLLLVVLVIDHEPQVRRFLRAALEASTYPVHDTFTGKAGPEQAALLRPDVVILDFNSTDMDGLQVLSRLREWSRVPVIVLSVRGADAGKIALLDAGAEDFLTKPLSIGELLARLRVAATCPAIRRVSRVPLRQAHGRSGAPPGRDRG